MLEVQKDLCVDISWQNEGSFMEVKSAHQFNGVPRKSPQAQEVNVYPRSPVRPYVDWLK